MKTESKMDFFTVSIYGDNWNIYKVAEEESVALDEGSAAELDFARKEITFKHCDMDTVRHEVFHALIGYTYTKSSELSAIQMEEVCCSIYADKAELLENLSQTISKKLKEL